MFLSPFTAYISVLSISVAPIRGLLFFNPLEITFLSFAHTHLLTYRREFMSYTIASHQGAIQMFWVLFERTELSATIILILESKLKRKYFPKP